MDHLLFWNAEDLERKLELFQRYYNRVRTHQGLDGKTPDEKADSSGLQGARLERYAWRSHCHGLFELPIAASTRIRQAQVPYMPSYWCWQLTVSWT